MYKGQLTKWKDDRGFGFIQPDDKKQKEVFLHISGLKDVNRRPQVGDIISYRITYKDGKIRACDASILGTSSKSTSPSKPKNTKSKNKCSSKFTIPFLQALLLALLPLIGTLHFMRLTGNPILLILYPVVSLVTFILYAEDKSRAQSGAWRIPEQTMHICEFFGGWLGGFIAQRILYHKNSKKSYQIMFWLIVSLHLAFWLVWLLSDGKPLKALPMINFKK